MNKQMKRFDRFIVCVLMGIVSLTFFACSNDEDEAITQVTYEMGFSSIESSSMTDLGTIERAYKKALGVTESKFTFEGSVNECDQRVKDACGSAEAELKSTTWNGTYTFEVLNLNTTYQVDYTRECRYSPIRRIGRFYTITREQLAAL